MLYVILGVSKSATDKEIKAAYRKLAMRWHPDRNAGSVEAEEKFKKIKEAYEVLSDAVRRAHFDTTGDYKQATAKDDELTRTFITLFQSILQNLGTRALHVDIVDSLRKELRRQDSQRLSNIENLKGQLDFKVKVRDKFTYKGEGNPLLIEVLQTEISNSELQIAQLEGYAEMGKRMLEMCDEYSYNADDAPKNDSELSWKKHSYTISDLLNGI